MEIVTMTDMVAALLGSLPERPREVRVESRLFLVMAEEQGTVELMVAGAPVLRATTRGDGVIATYDKFTVKCTLAVPAQLRETYEAFKVLNDEGLDLGEAWEAACRL